MCLTKAAFKGALSLHWNSERKKESEVAQLCPTLCDPVDCSLLSPSSMGFSRQEYWSGLPFPSPGDRPNSGIEPESPTLQADTLPSEPPGILSNAEGVSFILHEGLWRCVALAVLQIHRD